MDTVRQVVLCACAVSIALSMADMMMPSERFFKQLRFLFSLILMIGVTAPMVKGEVSLQKVMAAADAAPVTDTQEMVQESVCHSAEENLEAALTAQLTSAGIGCEALSVQIHIDEDGRISISEVRLRCPEPEAAKRILAAQLGADVPVTEMEATT